MRIGAMGNERNNNNFYQSPRGRSVRKIASRYVSNISRVRGVTSYSESGFPIRDNTRQVPRSQYMLGLGLSNG